MQSLIRDIVTAAAMGILVPGLVLNFGVMVMDDGTAPSEVVQETVAETTAVRVSMPVNVRTDAETFGMDMDGYLVGVVLAEMPTAFEAEALKAQAVVARTYARKAYETGGKHGDGSVCTDSGCCQAYISEVNYLEKGGTEEGIEKVRSAVEATSGQVLTYGEELIEAVYFSCSGGSTEDAAAVWGTDFPYLQAVSSPGEEAAAYYTDMAVFTAPEFQKALGVTLTGLPETWFGTAVYTEGGGVDTLTIGGKIYGGTELRSLLGLRSTAFSVETEGENITITTKGYGHRVGMSQYGADAMAVQGSSFEEILAHYYQGTVLTRLTGSETVS